MKKNSFQRLAEEASLEMKFERTVDRRSTTSLEQRTLMLLRALHGSDDFSDKEFRAARNKILEEMAADVLRGATRNDTSTGLRPGTTPFGREEAVQYSHVSKSVDLSVKPAAAERRLPDPNFADVPFEPLASQGPPEASPDLQDITKAALSAIEEAIDIRDGEAASHRLRRGALHAAQARFDVGDVERDPDDLKRPARKKARSWDPTAIFVIALMGLGAIGLWTVAQWGLKLFSSYYYH